MIYDMLFRKRNTSQILIILKFRCFIYFSTGALVSGVLVPWCSGALVPWCLVLWCSVCFKKGGYFLENLPVTLYPTCIILSCGMLFFGEIEN